MEIACLSWTELFELEHICIKMDLGLNNLQRLISHKTHQPTTQPTNQLAMFLKYSGLEPKHQTQFSQDTRF